MKAIRVLFLIPQMGMGGSERLVHSLIRTMDRDRFSPSLAWLNKAEALQEFRDLRVPLYCVPKVKRVDWATMGALAKLIKSEGIDVVNAHHFMPAVYGYYGCKVVANKPLVFTAHSRWEIDQTAWKWRVAGGCLLSRIAVSIGVTADVSRAIQDVFRIRPSQVVTIENGVDLDLFTEKRDARWLRRSLGLSDEDVVLGIVANLKKVKNHLFLFRAFSLLGKEYERVKLLVIGQGFRGEADNTEDDLRSFVNDHGLRERVLFLGFRADVAELLHVLDVFCLTSLREGLPIGLIEAMAAGLPAVGTNVEGIRDVISADVDGCLVELGDVMGLKDALTRLISSREWRLRLGSAGQKKAVERYSLNRCVREYEQLFVSFTNTSALS